MTSPSLFYREIQLTRGQISIVDAEEYEQLAKWKWHARWDKTTNSFYAARSTSFEGKYLTIMMHRVILGLRNGEKRYADHINHDTLDNRKSNLRIVTTSQNVMNQKRRSDNKSGYKGVTKLSTCNRWQASITINGKFTYLGSFLTPEDAYMAYCNAAKIHHGEYAKFS